MHNYLLHIVTVEGDTDRDSIPRPGPYTSLAPPTFPWNNLGKCIIIVHNQSRTTSFPTLLSPERYKWLHGTPSRHHNTTDFTQNLLRLMSRYHPRAKFFIPQSRSLKLANHWAILRQAIESTLLTTSELLGSPLNFSMSDGITYCSAFPEDTVLRAIRNSF